MDLFGMEMIAGYQQRTMNILDMENHFKLKYLGMQKLDFIPRKQKPGYEI